VQTRTGHGPAVAGRTLDLFAGVRVSDLAAARSWYERLLGGEPAFFPNEVEAVWALADRRWLYLLQDAARAGGSLVTVMVDDLDAAVGEIAARGLHPADRESYAGGARKAVYHDADGNEIGLGEVPADA
jgi:catechol 2,3-dioxygenase-like lactoylglutathione lyase family enzyme